MIVKRITLKTFKNFEKATFSFSPLTFIKGENGTGKTTLALDSLLFVLYGFSRAEVLADLPTRSVAKSCSVEVQIEHDNYLYTIKRKYPTHLTISREDSDGKGEELKFTNSLEVQGYINKLFGDRLNFMKFRMVDAYTKETNFLEEGQTAIKRILFAHSDGIFDNLKKKLNNIKTERERFCKDNAIVDTHYPSEKRLQLISSKYRELNKQENELITTINEFNNDFRKLEREIGQCENEKRTLDTQKKSLTTKNICYACKQILPKPKAKEMLEKASIRIKEINENLETRLSEKTDLSDIVSSHTTLRKTMASKILSLVNLKQKLETRIKQKEFKYSKKDVEIVKQAIVEVDNLSTYYLTESVKVLEPIINSILAKIEFNVSFIITEKGKFTLKLQKDNITYKYKDLSTGQKLILQIAFKLAILLDRNESGIVIADEGMSSLDEDNLQHILQIFENYPFQLILVLHRFENVPENIQVITLKKKEKKDEKNNSIK